MFTKKAQRAGRSGKRASLRAAFVATVSAGVAGAGVAGCDSDVITNPPPVDCPDTVPNPGSACEGEGECSYTDGCGEDMVAICDGGTWDVSFGGSCNPPPPCPDVRPAEGDVCVLTPGGTPVGCTYEVDTACGSAIADAECVWGTDENYRWAFSAPSCTPATPNCSIYESVGVCAADTTCRWLAPGCGDGPQSFEAGCYPIDDCTIGADDCPANTACTGVIANPCFGDTCDACGEVANVCL